MPCWEVIKKTCDRKKAGLLKKCTWLSAYRNDRMLGNYSNNPIVILRYEGSLNIQYVEITFGEKSSSIAAQISG
jgi:hypothetical protein